MSKKFLLFDNDGVLVETEKHYFRANVKALAEFEIELTFERYMEIMARGGRAWELAEEAGISKKEIEAKREKRDEYYQEYLLNEPIEIAGVCDVLEELKDHYKMGVVTTARRVDFDLIHNNREIIKHMDFTLCVEEYARAKPFADPYIAGMKMFNATAKECLVIEDSQRGLSAAVNAGIDCAVVYNEFTKTHDLSAATYKIKTLKELPALLQSLD